MINRFNLGFYSYIKKWSVKTNRSSTVLAWTCENKPHWFRSSNM